MNTVEMAHGSGGLAMQQLINRLFMEAFDNPWLAEQEDQARIDSLPSPPRATGWPSPLTAM
ncbi:carbamoyl dehydratase [Enterobacter cloacae]|uniref:Carbamoyl dehydratase n=1 Tax=Enterobacter cloacae TaxID=550 RepID=A0A377LTG3_ENTCL|nr:carbamoyl dehydratase [Enterobacter cloacae]